MELYSKLTLYIFFWLSELRNPHVNKMERIWGNRDEYTPSMMYRAAIYNTKSEVRKSMHPFKATLHEETWGNRQNPVSLPRRIGRYFLPTAIQNLSLLGYI